MKNKRWSMMMILEVVKSKKKKEEERPREHYITQYDIDLKM